MTKSLYLLLVVILPFASTPIFAQTSEVQQEYEARFDRVTLIVRDMEASMAFWRDVIGFEVVREAPEARTIVNPDLGWTEEGKVRFNALKSPDGAGLGLLEVKQVGFPDLNAAEQPKGYGGIVLVHIATNIEALYERAKEAGAVVKPLSLSRTGRSRQMYLRSPSGHFLEVYELLEKGKE